MSMYFQRFYQCLTEELLVKAYVLSKRTIGLLSTIETDLSSNSKEMLQRRLSSNAIFGVQFVVMLLVVCDQFIHYRFLRDSDMYFIYTWMESALILAVLQAISGKSVYYLTTKSYYGRSHLIVPLSLLHSLTTLVKGFDLLSHTVISSGSEFRQLSMIFSVPALTAILHMFSLLKLPSVVYYLFTAISSLQLIVCAQDHEFELLTSTCSYSLLFAAFCGAYLALIGNELYKTSIVELLRQLTFFLLVVLPFVCIANGEFKYAAFNFSKLPTKVFRLLAMSTSRLLSLVGTFLLIKISDPITCLLTLNFAFIPDTLIRTFVHHRYLTLSALKMFWLVGFQPLIMLCSPVAASASQSTRISVDNRRVSAESALDEENSL